MAKNDVLLDKKVLTIFLLSLDSVHPCIYEHPIPCKSELFQIIISSYLHKSCSK